jgi:hypothetical protein
MLVVPLLLLHARRLVVDAMANITVVRNDAFNAGKSVQICIQYNDELVVCDCEPIEALKYASDIIDAAKNALINKSR